MEYNVYILTEGRSGSSFLIDLLNNTGLFSPLIRECRVPDYDENSKSYNIIPNGKVIGDVYFIKRKMGLSLSDVKIKYPNMKFIHLYRRDIIGRSVSVFLRMNIKENDANFTRISSENIKKTFGENGCLLDNFSNKMQLYHCYQVVLNTYDRYDREIERCGIEALKVYYEDMLKDIRFELGRIFSYIGIEDRYIDIAIPRDGGRIVRDVFSEYYNKARNILESMLKKNIGG